MEVDEIQTQACNKLSRIGKSRNDSNKIGRKGGDQYQQDEDEEDGDQRKLGGINNNGGGGLTVGNTGTAIVGGFDVGSTDSSRLRAWHSSRIFRVSRASGGKDRHSKVLTAKGLRDRRVRLSVSTAIQFYDLQDRLGYDQPSKAVEWLIKAAAEAIAELPSLNTAFPDTPKQLSDEKRPNAENCRFDLAEVELDTDPSYQHHHHHQQQHQQQQQHNISLSKSACSSTSETSKGSVLSLSRSEIRVKARERARERTAKDKEKEKPDEAVPHHSSSHHQQNSHSSSFTELLTGGGHHNSQNPSLSATQQNPSFSNFVLKPNRNSPPTQMDYFTGLFGGQAGSMRNNHYSLGYSGQTHYGNAHHTPHTMTAPPPPPPFTVTGDHHHQELQQFSFIPDQLIPDATAAAAGSDYNLNFTISSGIAGFNRGTLQSNSSQSQLPHHLQQRFSSPADGPNIPFFIGNVTSASAAHAHTENHQFPAGFDGRLQLCYGDGGSRHSDLKGKGKS